MTIQQKSPPETFHNLGINESIVNILDRLKFTVPTPIQHKAIPPGLEGKDIIGIAQTGTGKTLAFAIPALQRLMEKQGRVLILLPTRELAFQVDETFQKIGHYLNFRTVLLIGGASMRNQHLILNKNPKIVIGTPGRILDHLQQKTLHLAQVNTLILDEADRMLDMGFAPQIKRILTAVPKERQTMLFSATMPAEIISIARSHMKLPLRVEIAPAGTTAERIEQEVFFVKREQKNRLLEKLLSEYKGSILVFSRTKFGARKILHVIRTMGHSCAEIHSNRSLSQRREALEGFKSGKYRILIATDIAARGIDVNNIEVVINYDLPENKEDYVHRIGRTGRAGKKGRAISFATPDQSQDIFRIERLIRTAIPVSKLPELPAERISKQFHPEPRQNFNRPRKPAPSHKKWGKFRQGRKKTDF